MSDERPMGIHMEVQFRWTYDDRHEWSTWTHYATCFRPENAQRVREDLIDFFESGRFPDRIYETRIVRIDTHEGDE